MCCACEIAFIADNVEFFLPSSLGVGQDKLRCIGANGIGSNLSCHSDVRDRMILLRANKVVISPYWLLFIPPFITQIYYLLLFLLFLLLCVFFQCPRRWVFTLDYKLLGAALQRAAHSVLSHWKSMSHEQPIIGGHLDAVEIDSVIKLSANSLDVFMDKFWI